MEPQENLSSSRHCLEQLSTFALLGSREKLVDSERGDGGFKTQPLSASGAINHNAPLQATLFPDASPDRGGGPCRINGRVLHFRFSKFVLARHSDLLNQQPDFSLYADAEHLLSPPTLHD